MISEVDDNMSGSIDFGEFLKVVEAQKERAENIDIEDLINKIDTDGSGEIEFEEFKILLST